MKNLIKYLMVAYYQWTHTRCSRFNTPTHSVNVLYLSCPVTVLQPGFYVLHMQNWQPEASVGCRLFYQIKSINPNPVTHFAECCWMPFSQWQQNTTTMLLRSWVRGRRHHELSTWAAAASTTIDWHRPCSHHLVSPHLSHSSILTLHHKEDLVIQ